MEYDYGESATNTRRAAARLGPGRQSVGRSHGRSLLVGGRQPSGIRQCVCLVSVTLSVALSVRVVLFVCTYISMYSIHLTNELAK